MSYANSSETVVGIVEESAWGTTPATPVFQLVRITGETLTHAKETIRSEEITPSADVADEIGVGASATGALNFELSFGDADTGVILAHALRSSWITGDVDDDDLEDLIAGIEQKSLTIEKKFELGATDDYNRYPGGRVNTLNLTVDQKGLVTGSVEFIGKGEVTATTIVSGATYASPNTGRVMAAPNVANIAVGGVSGTLYYSSLTFNLTNNLAAQNALGFEDAIGIRYGQREVTGNLTAYLDATSRALYEKFKAGTKGSFSFSFADPDGDEYIFTMPSVAFTEGTKQATGNNEDVLIELAFTAFLDGDLGSSVMIQRTAVGA